MSETNFIFPYHLFHQGDRIIVYGMENFCDDFFYSKGIHDGINIIATLNSKKDNTRILREEHYDAILLAIFDYNHALEAKRYLVNFGIRPEIIKWDKTPYMISDFLKNIYYPLQQRIEFDGATDEIKIITQNGYCDPTLARKIKVSIHTS